MAGTWWLVCPRCRTSAPLRGELLDRWAGERSVLSSGREGEGCETRECRYDACVRSCGQSPNAVSPTGRLRFRSAWLVKLQPQGHDLAAGRRTRSRAAGAEVVSTIPNSAERVYLLARQLVESSKAIGGSSVSSVPDLFVAASGRCDEGWRAAGR